MISKIRFTAFALIALIIFGCYPKNIETIDPSRVENGPRIHKIEFPIAYEQVEGDPMNVKKIRLKNGLTIYLSVNKTEPRIQTYVTTKAGSVQDPSTATGLAHYLEHMLFKGTDKIGTIDYEKEKVEIDKIKDLFEVYRKTTDTLARKNIYHQIDSISQVAAKYACANEFDQLHTTIGAEGTNAYTSSENTTYLTNIPSNQLESWVQIEAERFRNPVLRLFHTELEAVYEEKNISQDNHKRQMYYRLFEHLYQKHKYGTQTTIGTIEHLKNPSMVEIENYFRTYYVPNNMAVILAGDFEPDSAVKYIEKHFGKMEAGPIDEYTFEKEDTILKAKRDTILAPDAESLMMGFRLDKAGSRSAELAQMVDMILNNSAAGLIDLNINQQQKGIGVYSTIYSKKDYSTHLLGGSPTKGQTLMELEKLILDQIELVKKGEFPDWLIPAIINDFKISHLEQLDNNRYRADQINQAFVNGWDWSHQVFRIQELEKFTKKDIVEFANKFYNQNYVAIHKQLSDKKSESLKVPKPPITPLESNRNNVSEYLKTFNKNLNPKKIEPVFIKYKEEISTSKLSNGTPFHYLANTQNELFRLRLVYPIGSYHNSKLALACSQVNLLGTDSLSASQLAQEMYKLGLEYKIQVDKEETHITIKGLSSEFDQSLKLINHIFTHLQIDDNILLGAKQKIIQLRENELKNPKQILWQGLQNYAIYGKNSPLANQLSNKELEKISSKELLNVFISLWKMQPEILYFGNKEADHVKNTLSKTLKPGNQTDGSLVSKHFERLEMQKNKIYIVDYDLKQAEILFLSRDTLFDAQNYPLNKVFNEYYGGSMSSIIFQEIREKKALAYSTFGAYTTPKTKDDYHYVMAYVGTQADKMIDAMDAMTELLNNMPLDTLKFNQAVSALEQQYETNRITGEGKLYAFLSDRQLGYEYDKRKDIYSELSKMTLKDVEEFHKAKISNRNYHIVILGNTNILDLENLKKYGEIEILKVEDLFPY